MPRTVAKYLNLFCNLLTNLWKWRQIKSFVWLQLKSTDTYQIFIKWTTLFLVVLYRTKTWNKCLDGSFNSLIFTMWQQGKKLENPAGKPDQKLFGNRKVWCHRRGGLLVLFVWFFSYSYLLKKLKNYKEIKSHTGLVTATKSNL